jgi:TolB protein
VNRDDGAHRYGAAAALALLAFLLVILPSAASARPAAQKGALVYASVRNLSGEPFYPGVFPDLFTVRADGTGFRRLTRTSWWEFDPAWSPDGRLIAYSQGEGYCHASSCEWDASISVIAADGRHHRELTDAGEAGENSWIEASPAWSPDGKRIAFARTDIIDGADPRNGIYLVGVDGQGLARISRAHASSLAWSPNGRTIAFVHESERYIGLLNVATGRARRLRVSGLSAPFEVEWSPRGQFLALATGNALFVVRTAGGRAHKIVEERAAGEPAWSPDGCCLAFSAARKGVRHARSDLYIVSVRGGRPSRLTSNRGADFDPAWRP